MTSLSYRSRSISMKEPLRSSSRKATIGVRQPIKLDLLFAVGLLRLRFQWKRTGYSELVDPILIAATDESDAFIFSRVFVFLEQLRNSVRIVDSLG